MRIDINQHKISIGDKYKIFIDGQQKYTASTELFRFLAVINLLQVEGQRKSLTINKRWAWFKARYDIARNDNRNLQFRGESFWKLHYTCTGGPHSYDIYGHRGRKFSIYKNNVQVACWEKEAVTWFEGDNYSIRADDDCDVELIIAFCLVIDNYAHNNNEGNAITIDIGNIGAQARKFNPGWEPK